MGHGLDIRAEARRLMPRGRTVSQAQVNRVLKALKAEGLTAASIVVRADEVIITPGLTGEPRPDQGDELAVWRRKRAERADKGS